MSETFIYYVVDEKKLPLNLDGSDQDKYEQIVKAVTTNGTHWTDLELRIADFAYTLEKIDTKIEGDGFLPVLSFNNSPNNVLGDDSDCPSFGYFNPEQVKDLNSTLEWFNSTDILKLMFDQGGEVMEEVYNTVQSSAEEAAKRNYALAVIHS
jgi:hypothetical protein